MSLLALSLAASRSFTAGLLLLRLGGVANVHGDPPPLNDFLVDSSAPSPPLGPRTCSS